jgi:FlaA1/EpsC-like NDP-sugar epimerase
LQYVRHHSFLLDLDVLWQTFLSLLPKFRSAVPEIDQMLFGPIQRLCRKYIPWFVIDWLVGLAGFGMSGVIWRQRTVLNIGLLPSFLAALFLASTFSLVNWITGLNRIEWRRASNSDAMGVVFSASLASALSVIANKWLLGHQIFPSGMVLLGCFFALNGFIVMRYWRVVVGGLAHPLLWDNGKNGDCENVVIVGTGEMAAFVLRFLNSDPRGKNYRLIGFVDDDPAKRGARIRGVQVLGPTRRLARLVREFKVGVLLVALHDLEASEQEEILQACAQSGARIVQVPDIVSSLFAGMAAETAKTGVQDPQTTDQPAKVRAFAASRG